MGEHRPLFQVDTKGFYLEFANEYVVSIQFGECECEFLLGMASDGGMKTAAIGIMDYDGAMIPFANGDRYLGEQSPEQIAKLIYEVSQRPPQR